MRKNVNLRVLLIIITLLLLCLSGCGGNAKINTPDKDVGLDVPDALTLYSGEALGYSFLYPNGTQTAYNEADGVYLYAEEGEEFPYVLIYKGNTAVSPEKYFSDCDKLMQSTFSAVSSTPIHKVELGEKTLYFTRYQCEREGDTLIVDRYYEPYPDCFIQYTAISEEAGDLNTPLYYAISTLLLNEGAYKGAWSKSISEYTHPDAGFGISLPDMLDIKELTVGYMAASQDVRIMAICANADHAGRPIKSRQDFIDRADSDPNFVTSFIDWGDSMSFSEGSLVSLDGVDFYSYPAELSRGEELFNGAILVADAPDGCYILYYGVREGAVSYDAAIALMENCIASFKVNK